MEYRGYKEGDFVHIKKKPSFWSDSAGGAKPFFGDLIFPVTGIIIKIEGRTSHCAAKIRINGLDYGFDLSNLVEENAIEHKKNIGKSEPIIQSGQKFKVGDRVKVVSHGYSKDIGYEYTIREIFKGNQGYWYRENVGVIEGILERDLELISEAYLLGEDNKQNKIKKNMNSIVRFAKNLTLSSEEKLLREVGLKSDMGKYTNDALDIVCDLEAQEIGYAGYEELCEATEHENCVSVFEIARMFKKFEKNLIEIAKAQKEESKKK